MKIGIVSSKHMSSSVNVYTLVSLGDFKLMRVLLWIGRAMNSQWSWDTKSWGDPYKKENFIIHSPVECQYHF